MNDLNIGFYENLDINFTQALDMVEKDLTHDDLIELLKNGNIPEKQISALKSKAMKLRIFYDIPYL